MPRKKGLDLLLINPGGRSAIYQSLGATLAAIEPPFWAGLMATFIRKQGFTVKILDTNAENLEPGRAAWGMVDIALQGREPDAGGIALAQAFARAKAAAVVGESGTLKTGLAAAAAEKRLPAFDTLGTDIGRYTLVALMSGADSGYYGLGEQADAAFPKLPAE